MFTILNIINYFTGKYIPLSILILITIGIYYYIISFCSNEILHNDYYLGLLLIIMLMDITSLIVIFMYGDFFDNNSSNMVPTKKLKKNLKDKKKLKDKKNLKDKNDNNNNNDDKKKNNNGNFIVENKSDVNGLEKNIEMISLYDNDKSASIYTFIKFK